MEHNVVLTGHLLEKCQRWLKVKSLRLYLERIGDRSLVEPQGNRGSDLGCTPVGSCSI